MGGIGCGSEGCASMMSGCSEGCWDNDNDCLMIRVHFYSMRWCR